MRSSDATMALRKSPLALRSLQPIGTRNIPSKTAAHTPLRRIMPRETTDAVVPDEVETETLKLDAVVPLTVTEPGMEHVASCGEPVQVRVAAPLMPAPPMNRV